MRISDWSSDVCSSDLGVEPAQVAELEAARVRGYHDGGFKVWDISDKSKPRLLCHQRTFGFGTHRFDMDADYAYISTEMEGYLGNILVTYDLDRKSTRLKSSH